MLSQDKNKLTSENSEQLLEKNLSQSTCELKPKELLTSETKQKEEDKKADSNLPTTAVVLQDLPLSPLSPETEKALPAQLKEGEKLSDESQQEELEQPLVEAKPSEVAKEEVGTKRKQKLVAEKKGGKAKKGKVQLATESEENDTVKVSEE